LLFVLFWKAFCRCIALSYSENIEREKDYAKS
jgi:hypothetical protein